MGDVEEYLLNRRSRWGSIGYGVMLHQISCHCSHCRSIIEDDQYLVGTLQNWIIDKRDASSTMCPHMERVHVDTVELRHTFSEHVHQTA